MSGSSLDGLDIALCKIDDSSYELLKADTIAIPKSIQTQLRYAPAAKATELMVIDKIFASYCAKVCNAFLEDVEQPVDFIGSHGHTIYHSPEQGISLQIGSGAILSAMTSLPVVSDFRQGDVSLGGQGAPFVAIVEKGLFKGYDAYINLGGIANIAIHNPTSVTAFDVAPCNQVFNYFARQKNLNYDNEGKLAAAGKVHLKLLNSLNQLPYFELPAPKSMSNQWVNQEFISIIETYDISIEDKLATALAVINYQLSKVFYHSQLAKPAKILITGGGSYNSYLIEKMKDSASKFDCQLVLPNREIIDYKEAILMAYMAYLRWIEQANILSTVTGASRDSIGGAIYKV